ncbi:metallophosphoesterase family protein [Rhizobium sp. SG570]|uniref:metallophosphoesterase family protein n=1 Tax=Rhizobium sp. SG570 TaxID=2587113 RepID=UPI0014452670|nr:metallophosphoesterase family protein [Rhizobium sp. SG570]NKJ40314.1 serine/threonine protein phosphatase 1 [Rhizobium sp. SG570]
MDGIPILIRKLIDRVGKRLPGQQGAISSRKVARVPDGVRVYVIGDIHGRADLLAQTFARIDAHEAAHPVEQSITVFLGDYVDRGLRSREVIDQLIERQQNPRVVALRGNHDVSMLRALLDMDVALRWLATGGRETLHAYGIVVPVDVDHDTIHTVIGLAVKRIPASHKAFLERLLPYATIGDYAFLHAGIRPGIALENQSLDDLVAIRQPFLDCAAPHDFMIVHGHTPVSAPDFRPNRINIDTGAYITGNLTCLVLEEDRQFVLRAT